MGTYRVNFYAHLRQSWPVFLFLLVSPLLYYFFYFQFGQESVSFALYAAIVAFATSFLPQLVIHLRYLNLNQGMSFQIIGENRFMLTNKGGERIEFSNNEVISAITVASFAEAKNSLQFWPWQGYSFTSLTLESGKEIIITSLLVPLIDLTHLFPQTKIRQSIMA